MAKIRYLENRYDVSFSAEGGPIWIIISQTGAEWHVDCSDMVKIDTCTRCRIPIWRTFGQIPWHVIPEPPATLQGAASWRIHVMIPELRVTLQVLPLGEFNGMSPQSHVSHCKVWPLGEFTVMIPEPHVTLQGAVTWRNQCHFRATLQGVIISSAILTRSSAIADKSCNAGL